MLRSSLDLTVDALYVTVSDVVDKAVATTREIEVGTLVDENAAGQVVGIEVLNPSRPWAVGLVLKRYDFSDDDFRQLLELSHRFGVGPDAYVSSATSAGGSFAPAELMALSRAS